MRKIVYVILIITSFMLTSRVVASPPEAPVKDYILVISLNIFKNAEFSDVNATAKVLADHLKRSNNWLNSVTVVTVKDMNDMKTRVGNQFDVAIISTQEYMDIRNLYPIQPFAVNLTAGKIGYDYLFLVNQSDGFSNIRQLSHQPIYIFGSKEQSISGLWLDKLLRDNKLPKKEKYFSDIIYDQKSMNVVLPVFMKKAKACIIGSSVFNVMTEMNPQLGKNMKAINRSENVISVLAVVNQSHSDKKSQDKLMNAILSVHETSFGKQMCSLFNFDQMVPYKPEYIQSYLDFLH